MKGLACQTLPKVVFLLAAIWIIDSSGAEPAGSDLGSATVIQPNIATGIELDEISISGPRERNRKSAPDVILHPSNNVFVHLDDEVGITLNLVRVQPEVVFRRSSSARQLPTPGSKLSAANKRLSLELLPDRLISRGRSHVSDAAYQLAGNVDEADGLPAHIPFGRDVALINLDYLSMHHNQFASRIFVANAMHPQTRRCEHEMSIFQLWPEGANQYILIGSSQRSCERFLRSREADLLFAEGIPREFKQLVMDIYDPIASRMAARLGSEPGNMFVAWWPDSLRSGFRLEPTWNRNSLLLFHGSAWLQGIDAAQMEALRTAFIQEQIQRRIRESDVPGPFTQSAAHYLQLLTISDENNTTRQRLMEELPSWLARCAGALSSRSVAAKTAPDVPTVECGLLVQFIFDAVARSTSVGTQDIFSIWRKLLNASFLKNETGVTPEDFLGSSPEARSIVREILGGETDWATKAVALQNFGIELTLTPGGNLPVFEVRSLLNFGGDLSNRQSEIDRP